MTYRTAKTIIYHKLIRALALCAAFYCFWQLLTVNQAAVPAWGDFIRYTVIIIAAVVVAYDKDRYLAKTHKCRSIFLQG